MKIAAFIDWLQPRARLFRVQISGKVCVIWSWGVLILLSAGLWSCDTHAGEERPNWIGGADLRAGYFTGKRMERDGGERSESDLRTRLRAWLQGEIDHDWRFRARLAGSFSSDGNKAGLKLDRYRATPTGTLPGEVHLDEFYLHRARVDSVHDLRSGRFQTGFNLPIVPGKSLDRNDSSNVGIGWTDGFHLRSRVSERWSTHLIGQINQRKGAGNTVRAPLDFERRSSRIGTWFAVEAIDNPGPMIMRLFSINWVPDGLAAEGTAGDHRDDYLTATAKTAAAWPLGRRAMRLVLAGEVGHAFNRPERSVVGLPGQGQVAGNGFQASANLYDMRPGHHIGMVYGRAQGGWLTSNDYRSNDELFEIRYQRRFAPNLSMEIRYRWRRELEQRIGADRLQLDEDVYVRLSWRSR